MLQSLDLQTDRTPEVVQRSTLLSEVQINSEEWIFLSNISGGIAVLDADARGILQHCASPTRLEEVLKRFPSSSELIHMFLFQDYLVEAGVDEYRLQTEGVWHARTANVGGGAFVFIVTRACNLRCTYCYESHPVVHMSDEVWKRAADFVERRANDRLLKEVALTWYGGEPLMRWKRIREFLDQVTPRLDGRQIRNLITTNGTMITDEVADFFVNYGFDTVQISIDGLPQYHDKRRFAVGGRPTFDAIIDGVKRIAGRVPYVNIRVNVDKLNIDGIDPLMEFLEGEGLLSKVYPYFARVSAANEVNMHYAPNLIDESELEAKAEYWMNYAQSLKGEPSPDDGDVRPPPTALKHCFAHSLDNFVFDVDGRIYKCWTGMDRPKFEVGHLSKETPIDEEEHKKWLRLPETPDKACQRCKMMAICAGGCADHAYAQFGTFDAVACPQDPTLWRRHLVYYVQHSRREFRDLRVDKSMLPPDPENAQQPYFGVVTNRLRGVNVKFYDQSPGLRIR